MLFVWGEKERGGKEGAHVKERDRAYVPPKGVRGGHPTRDWAHKKKKNRGE